MKKYGTPLLIAFIGGWLVKIENRFLSGSSLNLLATLTIAFSLFGLGISLQNRRKNKTWIKKLIVSFTFLFLILYDLDVFKLDVITILFDYMAIQKFTLYILYVYLGWLFFD